MKDSIFAYVVLTVVLSVVAADVQAEKRWLAGDHHVHSQFSVGWDRSVTPPKPVPGGDAVNPIPDNASLARKYGLSWMVTTDHGGPNHSKVNRDLAYPELLVSRKQVPEVVQFYGMELNTPAADHSSLIIPHTSDEREVLFKLEKGFDKNESFPFFVTTGDLVSEVNVRVSLGDQAATMGSTLSVPKGAKVHVEITVRDPSGANANQDTPSVNRVDLITGDVTARSEDLATNSNPSTAVSYRFSQNEWQRDGEVLTMTHRIKVNNRCTSEFAGPIPVNWNQSVTVLMKAPGMTSGFMPIRSSLPSNKSDCQPI